MRDKLRISLIRPSRWTPELWMSDEYSLYADTACVPNNSVFITSENPRMALSGVRNSWLFGHEIAIWQCWRLLRVDAPHRKSLLLVPTHRSMRLSPPVLPAWPECWNRADR